MKICVGKKVLQKYVYNILLINVIFSRCEMGRLTSR